MSLVVPAGHHTIEILYANAAICRGIAITPTAIVLLLTEIGQP